MKKLANLTALFIFVSVNVLTPISYAQETPEIEDEISTVVSQDEQKKGEETSSKEVGEELPVAIEEQPVPVEEQLEAIPEDTVPSLIDLVVDAVDNFKEEVTNLEVTDPEDSNNEDFNNEDLVMPSRGEITVADAPAFLGPITHDVQKGIIKLKMDNDGENYEVRIKDKNEGASEITLTGNAFQLKQLMNSMCYNRNLEGESITVSELDYSDYECDSNFAAAASGLTNTAISTYADGMAYINAHTNSNYTTYGDYYRWGNDGYAKYEELSCKQVLAAEGLSDGCSLYVDNEARNRGFMNLSNRDNYGWYEGVYDNPCDASKGEYLPSPEDWGKLVSLRGDIRGFETAQPSDADFSISANYIDDFRTDLMIPKAGFVSIGDPYEVGAIETLNNNIDLYYANRINTLRTSNGYDGAGYIVLDDYYDGGINYNWYGYNNMANPVRCFVVTNPVTVTFKYNNGDLDKVIKIQSGSWLREPEMPVRNGHTFNGWYDGDDEYYFEDEVEEDLTLTAQRTECKEGQIVKNNQCVYEVEHDKIKGILKVTDGERTIYVKDKNVGATISAGLDDVSRLYMLMDEECIFDGYSDIETDRGDYIDCSPKFYEEAAKILGLPSITDSIIEHYLDEYYYLDDENYVASFGNYYFWGNNTGSSYTGLEIKDDGTLRNASELLSIGFNGGALENGGWVEGYYDNPCDNSKGEYLPTSDDWATVMNIWESNNPEFMDDYDDGGLREVGEYEPAYTFGGKAAAQFQQDLLIPTAGYIYKGCETAMEFGDTETEECGGLSYHYEQHYTPVTTLRAGKNKHGYFGSLFGNPYSIDMYSTMDLDDNMASPVRCFVFVEPKDVKFVDGSNSWNVKVESGDSVNEPEHSQSEGRTFNGWYNGSQKWDFESPVTSNITLVAKYDTITNRVTFVSNGGSLVNPMDIEHGQPIINLPRPTKEGYNFDGWYMDEGLTQKYTNQPITQAITLYAKWSEKSSSPSSGYSGGGGSSSRPSSKGSGPSTTDVKSVDNEPSTPIKEVKADPKPVVPGKGANSTGKVNSNQELFAAYKWAYDNGLTKYANMSDARMDDLLNRQEMAKISTIFATKFQGETPNEKKRNDCSQYPDLWKTTKDMQEFIIQSCELGYMGYRANGVDYLERFRPYTPVSVAEVSIILSRIMWQNRYAIDENLWYQGHLHAVYENNLLDNISKPFDYIARKDAYIMLYRISKTL